MGEVADGVEDRRGRVEDRGDDAEDWAAEGVDDGGDCVGDGFGEVADGVEDRCGCVEDGFDEGGGRLDRIDVLRDRDDGTEERFVHGVDHRSDRVHHRRDRVQDGIGQMGGGAGGVGEGLGNGDYRGSGGPGDRGDGIEEGFVDDVEFADTGGLGLDDWLSTVGSYLDDGRGDRLGDRSGGLLDHGLHRRGQRGLRRAQGRGG
jgi:hypothetical protein